MRLTNTGLGVKVTDPTESDSINCKDDDRMEEKTGTMCDDSIQSKILWESFDCCLYLILVISG